MLLFLAYSGLITGIAAFIFGLFVYLKNRRGIINQSYGLLSLSIVIWGVSYFFWPLPKTKEQALISFQLLHVGAILVAPTYLWFIAALLNLNKKLKKIIIGAFVVASFFLAVVPTSLFIKDMVPQYIFYYWAVPGVMYHFYLIFWFGCGLYAWLHLLIHYRRSIGSRKNQLKYVLIGTGLGILGGATNYLPWYKIYIPPVGTILVGIHVAIFAYAILKYHLMDINIVITRTGIFVAVYTLVLGLPYILMAFGKTWLVEFLGMNWWIAPLVLLTFLATVGPFVYIYLQKRAETILFREQHRYQEILRQLVREMGCIHNLKKLLTLIVETITKSVQISHSAIYLLDTKSGKFILGASCNLNNKQVNTIDKKDTLIKWFTSYKELLVYEEINRKAQENVDSVFTKLEKTMQMLNATVIVPSFSEDKLQSLLILGNKQSGKIYTSEDLNAFSLLASQLPLAIENALIYENIEDQVRQRTEELVQTQKQLIQAEKLATVGTLAGGVAHEINNPLTAILTNVQMLLAAPTANPEELKESHQLIEEATKRCRTIIQKLMTYARKPLETAAVSKIDLLDVLKNVISFVGYQLEQENVKVNTDIKEDDYFVMGNQNELEQVFTNLILNARDAIKQIKKNGVVGISFSKDNGWIQIDISDEGAGIPAEIRSKIFDPFFTTKDVGRGTGLGLSICQAIIEKHNGSISFQSEANKGTTFTVRLPRAKKALLRKDAK